MKNTSPLDSTWIKTDENYRKTFNKHMREAPKCKGRAICIKFHVTGYCAFGNDCQRKDTHENEFFDDKAKRELGKWIQMCRNKANQN